MILFLNVIIISIYFYLFIHFMKHSIMLEA